MPILYVVFVRVIALACELLLSQLLLLLFLLFFTRYGRGVIESFRPESQQYVVVLDWRLAEDKLVRAFVGAASVARAAFTHAGACNGPDTNPASVMGKAKTVTTSAFHPSVPFGGRLSAKQSLELLIVKGSAVLTPYGSGACVRRSYCKYFSLILN